jgi:hypothetical protein
MLENLSSDGEGNGVRQVDKNCVTHLIGDVFGWQVFKLLSKVFLNDPKVLSIKLQTHVSVIKCSYCAFEIRFEFFRELGDGEFRLEYSVGNVIKHPPQETNFFERNKGELAVTLPLLLELKVVNYY